MRAVELRRASIEDMAVRIIPRQWRYAAGIGADLAHVSSDGKVVDTLRPGVAADECDRLCTLLQTCLQRVVRRIDVVPTLKDIVVDDILRINCLERKVQSTRCVAECFGTTERRCGSSWKGRIQLYRFLNMAAMRADISELCQKA